MALPRDHRDTARRMDSHFFEKPILNSPHDYPGRHWALDANGQPTQRIVDAQGEMNCLLH